jgi:hypothetical protein
MEISVSAGIASNAINKIVEGMIIAGFSPSNARDSIRFNCEEESNEIDESDSHFEKHDEPRISTRRGIKIDSSTEFENAYDSIRVNREFDSNESDESDEFENAYDSIRVNRELDSNEIDESDIHCEKLDEPRISISHPISISDELEKLRINV